MNMLVPYTIIIQDSRTGSVSSRHMDAPQDTQAAKLWVTTKCETNEHVVALVRGNHPVIIGSPGAA